MEQTVEGRRVGPYTPTGICRMTKGDLKGAHVITTKEKRTVAVRSSASTGDPVPGYLAQVALAGRPVTFILDDGFCAVGFEWSD